MAVLGRLEDFLKKNEIDYETITHPEAYTAQEVAAALHVSGHDIAKVVIVKAGERFVMVVVPASGQVDLDRLARELGEKKVRLATEEEFKGMFPDCEPGGEPPFGNLYNIETYVDRSLAEDEHIFFNAGNHTDAVGMDYTDYARVVKPRVAEFTVHREVSGKGRGG